MTQWTITCTSSGALCFSIAFVLFFVSSEAQDLSGKCVTPNNFMGECVAIRNCPYVLNFLKNPLSSGNIDSLRKFQCGFQGSQPYVCCPDEVLERTETTETNGHPNMRLLPRDCGRTFENSIVRDPQTHLYQYPWLVLLGYSDEDGVKYRCGGTIINERYILTAAHCISKLPNGLHLSNVRIGENNLDSEMDCKPITDEGECAPPAEDYGIERTIPHPQFQNKLIMNDIGLIRLDRPVNFSLESTKPICLPLEQGTLNFTRKVMRIAGWGVTMEGQSSLRLLTASVRVVNTASCADQYKKYTNIYNSTQICLQPEYTGRDLCVGDSGGPLMDATTGDGRTVQFGVMSFALGVCRSGQYPRVYTLVEPYMTWILDSIKV